MKNDILKRKRIEHYLPNLWRENNFLKTKRSNIYPKRKDNKVDKLDYMKIKSKMTDIKKKNDR